MTSLQEARSRLESSIPMTTHTIYWSNMSADLRATNDNEDVLLRYRLFITVSNIDDSKSNTFKHISSDDRDKENTDTTT